LAFTTALVLMLVVVEGPGKLLELDDMPGGGMVVSWRLE
jgi:hypothetical protein